MHQSDNRMRQVQQALLHLRTLQCLCLLCELVVRPCYMVHVFRQLPCSAIARQFAQTTVMRYML